MASVMTCPLAAIGETAGRVWRLLDEQGTMSLSKVCQAIDAPRDLVMQAIGWLAREDKLALEETPRGRFLSLRS